MRSFSSGKTRYGCRISDSNICEVDEKRLRELGPARDFNRLGSVEIYFYSPESLHTIANLV
jgi:hypothetical protein